MVINIVDVNGVGVVVTIIKGAAVVLVLVLFFNASVSPK